MINSRTGESHPSFVFTSLTLFVTSRCSSNPSHCLHNTAYTAYYQLNSHFKFEVRGGCDSACGKANWTSIQTCRLHCKGTEEQLTVSHNFPPFLHPLTTSCGFSRASHDSVQHSVRCLLTAGKGCFSVRVQVLCGIWPPLLKRLFTPSIKAVLWEYVAKATGQMT